MSDPPDAPRWSITWVGHATVLLEVAGVRILTDPLLTSRVAHLRRRVPIPALDPVDVVLISHVHMDHLHLPSLRRTAAGARIVVPAGAEGLVGRLGFTEVTPVGVGDAVNVTVDVTVEAVPANHLRGRGPHSRVRADPVGYVVHAGGRSVYFAGDTDLFDEMSELGPIDAALLPTWGWGPTLGERHLDPQSAAVATMRIDPRSVVPIHWGTYSPLRAGRGAPSWLDDPIAAFDAALDGRDLRDRLLVVRPGGSIELD